MSDAYFLSGRRDGEGWNRRLTGLLEQREYFELAQLKAGIDWAYSQQQNGRWVAMALSYEAAPAFDDAFVVQQGKAPLLWVGVYAESDDAPMIAQMPPTDGENASWNPLIDEANYLAHIERIRRYIYEGDCYQVNYTFPLQRTFHGDPLAWFFQLQRRQQAGFAAYLNAGSRQLLSFSPELFFKLRSQTIHVWPMKGTAAPGVDRHETQAQIAQLQQSVKDRAENVMIVDLLRNDLSRIALSGSVCVEKLFEVEQYPTVLQMISRVKAELDSSVDLWQILQALFPCGSITGAPKVRTMEIINELEVGPRGFYTGAIGLLEPTGDMTFNVPIRTVTLEPTGDAIYYTGSGVTYASSAPDEYAECLLKTRFLNKHLSS